MRRASKARAKRTGGKPTADALAPPRRGGSFSDKEFELFFQFHFGTSSQALYHYTRQDALFSILSTRNFWLTHIQHLNDATEYAHAFDILKRVIKQNMSSTNETQRRLLEYIRDSAVQKFDATVFVLCFSDKHDDLNQCRSYASPGNGYCIGYQSASLKMFAAYNRARLGKCVYSGEKQEEVVNQLVAFFLDDLMGYFPFFGPGELNEGLIEKRAVLFWRYFQQVAPLFKHPAFAEEEEARIVLHLPATSKDIKFRSGPMSIVPYVSLRQL